jgi:hypothetical protein
MFFAKLGSTVTKAMVASAVLLGSTAATANTACQPGTGCVLPVTDAAPPPPPVADVPPPAAPIEAAPLVEAGGGGIGLFAILAGLAALGLLYFLVFDDEDEPVSP